MFFWAIFDQSASTWIFFADTYMDTTIIGEKAVEAGGQNVLLSGDTVKSLFGDRSISMSADAIQAFNPLFIIILVPLSVFIFKFIKIKATTKIIMGFVLTGLSMVIMSLAGNSAAKASKEIRVILPEGEFILPKFEKPIMDYASKAGGKPLNIPGAVSIMAPDAKYNEANKKIEFTSGTIQLSDAVFGKLKRVESSGGLRQPRKVSALAVFWKTISCQKMKSRN